MRFYAFTGQTILGLRLGVSIGPNDWKKSSHSNGGFVYVAHRPNGDVKIGMTNNPPQRLRNLQTGSAEILSYAFVAATNTPSAIEGEAKRILNLYRLQGEWFEVSPEIATAAINLAASRLNRELQIIDPDQAAKIIPPVLGSINYFHVFRNLFIIIFAICGFIWGAWLTINFIDNVNQNSSYYHLNEALKTS